MPPRTAVVFVLYKRSLNHDAYHYVHLKLHAIWKGIYCDGLSVNVWFPRTLEGATSSLEPKPIQRLFPKGITAVRYFILIYHEVESNQNEFLLSYQVLILRIRSQ